MEKICNICNGLQTCKKGYWVCENCRVVFIHEHFSYDNEYEAIEKCLEEIQEVILSQNERCAVLKMLHQNRQLSDEEQRVYYLLDSFQRLRGDFLVIIAQKIPLHDKYSRQLLYSLLEIIDDVKAVLGIQ